MTSCPFCQNELVPPASECGACRLRFTPGPSGDLVPFVPPVRAGEAIAVLDFRSEPLPGSKKREASSFPSGGKQEPVPHGIEVAVDCSSLEFTVLFLRVRDAVIRAQVMVQSPNGEAFVGARVNKHMKMTVGYRFVVSPTRSEFRLERLAYGPEGSAVDTLCRPTRHPLVAAAASRPILLEIGVQGPTVQGSIDGTPVWSVHDPVLGVGCPSIGVGRAPGAQGLAKATFAWMDVRTVVQ